MILVRVETVALFMFIVKISQALLCFNCSSTQKDTNQCAGDFAPYSLVFNNTRHYLTNCTGENAMCFVRSWTARARHAWIVQRGCYMPTQDDPLPRSMNIPTRSMTCKHEKHPDAEYRVCMCRSDWCNTADNLLSLGQSIVTCYLYVIWVISQAF